MDLNVENIIPLLDEIKIQTEVLIPVLEVLRERYGKEQASKIIRDALCPHVREKYHNIGKLKSGSPFAKWNEVWNEIRPRIGNNVEREYITNDENSREYNVKRCRFAEYFIELGEPELGKILMCDFDYYVAEVGEPVIELHRTKTLMEGSDCCDFKYKFHHKKG
jgi:hypothetical protein